MPMTKAELEEEISECVGDTDGIDPFNAVMVVCDALDLDPHRTLGKIRMGVRLTEHEYVIEDLLTASQSNLERSLHRLQRAAAAQDLIQQILDEEDGPDPDRSCTCGHPDCGAC